MLYRGNIDHSPGGITLRKKKEKKKDEAKTDIKRTIPI